MKKSASILFIFSLLMLFTSCGKEKLTPLVSTMTVNELRNDQPINFSYRLDATEIKEYGKNAGKFPLFGKLFQAMAFVLANTSISSKGGHSLEIDPIEVDLNSMGKIDFDYIDWIRLDSLLIHVDNAKRKDNLEFIEKLEIYALLENPLPGMTIDKNGMVRMVYYNKKVDGMDCDDTCINLKLEKLDWKEIIKNNPKIKLQPKIVINSVPRSTMALAGSVSFSIKFNLGF